MGRAENCALPGFACEVGVEKTNTCLVIVHDIICDQPVVKFEMNSDTMTALLFLQSSCMWLALR